MSSEHGWKHADARWTDRVEHWKSPAPSWNHALNLRKPPLRHRAPLFHCKPHSLHPMKDTIANKIASFVATLNVADKSEFKPVWENQPPLAFTEGIAAVRPMIAALSDKAAKQSADISGAAKQLRQLRKQFETQLHALARAAYQCLTKQGQTATAEKVNLTPTDLHDARGVALAGIGSTVLDAAEPLLALVAGGPPAAAAKYFTQEQFDAVDALWQQFSAAVGAPASARSNRKALTGQLPDDVRSVEAQFSLCDDFLPQFAIASDEGRQFSDAWFAARQVIDLGRRAAKPNSPAPPTP